MEFGDAAMTVDDKEFDENVASIYTNQYNQTDKPPSSYRKD